MKKKILLHFCLSFFCYSCFSFICWNMLNQKRIYASKKAIGILNFLKSYKSIASVFELINNYLKQKIIEKMKLIWLIADFIRIITTNIFKISLSNYFILYSYPYDAKEGNVLKTFSYSLISICNLPFFTSFGLSTNFYNNGSDLIKFWNEFLLISCTMYLVTLVLKTPQNASFKSTFISGISPIFVI